MRKIPLTGWISTVVTLIGVVLLIIVAVHFLNLSASSVSAPDRPDSMSRLVFLPAATQQIAAQRSLTTYQAAQSFDGKQAYQHVLTQVEFGPRPTGSQAGGAAGNFIGAELNRVGWSVETQTFIFKGVKGRNIIGKQGNAPPRWRARPIIIGAHYDTRPAADQDPDPARRDAWIDGANDGASGAAVLLELARVLESNKLKDEVWIVFFDAEDRGFLDGWPFSVGARHFADKLTVSPQSVVIVDMVGDADQVIYFERNSTRALQEEIWTIAAELGYQAFFMPGLRHTVFDDHIPFRERGIPAVDIIDFDYPYWHTTADTVDKVAPESLERVGRTLEVWLEEKR